MPQVNTDINEKNTSETVEQMVTAGYIFHV